jgi:hypothetical protein
MHLLIFQIVEASAMQHCIEWSDGNIVSHLFKDAKISSQDISRLIAAMGEQRLQTKFFKEYIANFFKVKLGF